MTVAGNVGAVQYQIVDLGTLGGGAYAVNNSGQVLLQGGYLWDSVNGLESIGSPGFKFMETYSINNTGQVIGTAFNYSDSEVDAGSVKSVELYMIEMLMLLSTP
jgi:hypothetical protein